MKAMNELRTLLRSVDHKSYPAYKSLAGVWQFGSYVLSIDHVQGDPFASPSSLHVEIGLKNAGFPEAYYRNAPARIALQDFLTRRFASLFEDFNFKAKGSGKERAPFDHPLRAGGIRAHGLSDYGYKADRPVSCGLSGFWTDHQCGRAGEDSVRFSAPVCGKQLFL